MKNIFIRKNTKEIRDKLEKMGFSYSGCDNKSLNYIYVFVETKHYSIFADYHFINFPSVWKNDIDCDKNEDMFFMLLGNITNDETFNSFKTYIVIDGNNSNFPYGYMSRTLPLMSTIDPICYRLATQEEIINFFKNKNNDNIK